MEYYYECEYTIGARDVGARGHCRPSALLAHLQAAATAAAADLKVSREEMLQQHNVFWMLARIWFRLNRPLYWGEAVICRTWHRGDKGVSMYRDYDLYVDGVLVGEAVSTWVLADQDTRALFRLGRVDSFSKNSGGSLCKERKLYKLHLPEGLELKERRLMRYSDTDINGHVNNARYADFVCDALPATCFAPNRYIASMQLGYLGECHPGEVLSLYTGVGEDGLQYVQGLGQDQSARFSAWVEIKELT